MLASQQGSGAVREMCFYAVKKEMHEISKKIARPVVNKLKRSEAEHFVSDCPMAAEQIVQDLDDYDANHPMSLLRKAYGI